MGTEVKSLRQGRASLVDGFVEIDDHEAWLHGVHIPEYTQGTWTNHSARRKRKLLLQPGRDRQDRAQGQRARATRRARSRCTSRTAGPRSRSRLAKGKKSYDKRHALAERQADREKEQAVGRRLKGMGD